MQSVQLLASKALFIFPSATRNGGLPSKGAVFPTLWQMEKNSLLLREA